MYTETLLENEWDTMEHYCYRKYKYDKDLYDECYKNCFGRCKEHWRCSCCCGLKQSDNQKEQDESHDKKCGESQDEICIPKSYLPAPCIYPVQCLVLCKNSRREHFRIYANDILGFSLKFKIKEHPHKGVARLDSNHTGKGIYTPNYDVLGFDRFVITVSSVYNHQIIHSVDTTVCVRIELYEMLNSYDLSCDCRASIKACED